VSFEDRRAHPRYPLRLRVTLRMRTRRKKARAIMMDLSRGGMLLKTKGQLELGSELVLIFRAKPDMVCEARGRVVRVMNTPLMRGLGINFDDTNKTFDQLLTLLERLPTELRQKFLKESIERELTIL
jgi:hypothetical protein